MTISVTRPQEQPSPDSPLFEPKSKEGSPGVSVLPNLEYKGFTARETKDIREDDP